ncbi:MAG TPA: hypothetical protein VNB22_06330, partial [Pyrinomonadaceae bacterium]|nr:hypothetical protein [Pyrinomonadaceae bacterium]
SLSKKVWDKIKKDFEPFNQTEISETLNLYNDDERERVQIYILQLAKGNKDEVYSLVESANQDYRDIIFWAENPEESQTNAAVIEQIINEFGESKK